MSADSFVIPTPPQFDFRRTVPSHGWIMLAPFRWSADSGRLSYVYQCATGEVLRLEMTASANSLRVHCPDVSEIGQDLQAELIVAIKGMLHIDRDLDPFYFALRAYAEYEWVERERHGRILISPSMWEDLAKVLLTTNCSWSNTVAWSERLCRLGAPHPTSESLHAFPTAQRIAAMSLDELAGALRAGYRNAYLHELAQKIAQGDIDPESWRRLDSDGLYKAVKSLKGFGEYAARTIVTMYGHADKIALDSSCRTMFAELHNGGSKAKDATIAQHYARFGGWRGLVLWLDNMRYWARHD